MTTPSNAERDKLYKEFKCFNSELKERLKIAGLNISVSDINESPDTTYSELCNTYYFFCILTNKQFVEMIFEFHSQNAELEILEYEVDNKKRLKFDGFDKMKSEFQLRKIEPSQIRFIEENKWEYESKEINTSEFISIIIDRINQKIESKKANL